LDRLTIFFRLFLNKLIDCRHATTPFKIKSSPLQPEGQEQQRVNNIVTIHPCQGEIFFILMLHGISSRPVPAEIKRPMITFSFKPERSSILPAIAALVSTLVVSWNDAAEMNESVDREALVTPSSKRFRRSRLQTILLISAHSLPELPPLDLLASIKRESPASVILTRLSICRTMVSMCLSLILTPAAGRPPGSR
jgi:hypothetical protein